MKTAALREVKAKLSEYCDRAQHERVLITKHGKPVAVMIGVAGQELEEVLTTSNPDFWRLVEERRRQPTVSIGELRRRLATDTSDDAPTRASGRRRRQSASAKRGGRRATRSPRQK